MSEAKSVLQKFNVTSDASFVDRLSRLKTAPGIELEQLNNILEIARALRPAPPESGGQE